VAQALILDSEAIHALAAPARRGALALRARAIARVAHARGVLVRVPAAVLAEVCRGARYDAAINHLLNREAIRVADLTRPIGQRAGALLAHAGMSSVNAVDAFVVATALEYDSAVIATGDADDIERLSDPYDHVSVMTL
jgi:predicted nucleic acid-binding protein